MVKPQSERTSQRGRPPIATSGLTNEVASTRDGRDITRPFVKGLQQSRDPRLWGAIDWGVYEQIEKDDQVFSTFQQRRTAVVSRNWHVVPGDETDPRSVEAADRFGKTLQRVGWDRITDKMLFATMRGYAVAEVMWGHHEGLLDFTAIRVRHARRFRFTDSGELKLLTRAASQGEALPPRKFWVLTAGGSDDDEFYGRGLAEWLYWPVTFKRNGIRFWNIFLDKFSAPTAVAKYRPGMARSDIEKLLGALQAIATDSGIVIPEGAAVELLQAAKSGTADYATMCDYMDKAIAKIILSQTMTTQDGASLSQAQVHAGVKLEVVKADADLLSDSFNAEDGPARWWTDVNYGPDVAAPRVMREVEEETDTKAQAETDIALKQLGWERDDESFIDEYGEGYRRVAQSGSNDEAPAMKRKPENARSLPDAANDPASDDAGQDSAASFAADDPRTLYVYRQLLNPEDVIAWAREQGIGSMLPASDLHVTVTYSKKPVNWMKMGGFWGWGPDSAQHLVPPGGPRLVERFGNALVIVFTSGHLEQRHREMRAEGASWDHDGYYPHVTITYDSDIDPKTIAPYQGELRFGPEVFEPIEENWDDAIVETPTAVSFADGGINGGESNIDPEEADELVDAMIARAGYRASKTITDPILGAILTADSAEDLARLLNQTPGDTGPLATTLENASFALRLAAENGEVTV